MPDRYADADGNVVDTANFYSDGHPHSQGQSRAVIPISGPRTVEQLDDNLAALDLTLPHGCEHRWTAGGSCSSCCSRWPRRLPPRRGMPRRAGAWRSAGWRPAPRPHHDLRDWLRLPVAARHGLSTAPDGWWAVCAHTAGGWALPGPALAGVMSGAAVAIGVAATPSTRAPPVRAN